MTQGEMLTCPHSLSIFRLLHLLECRRFSLLGIHLINQLDNQVRILPHHLVNRQVVPLGNLQIAPRVGLLLSPLVFQVASQVVSQA